MGRWCKRILLIAVVLGGLVIGVVIISGDRLAATVVRHAVDRAQMLATARGIELRDVEFTHARFAGFGVIRCEGLSGTAHRSVGIAATGQRAFAFDAASVVFDAGWPWSGRANLTIVDGVVRGLGVSGAPSGEHLTRIRARVDFAFSWSHPTRAAAMLEDEARRLLREGRTLLPLALNAVGRFTVAGRLHELPVRTEIEANGGGARIVLDQADIERLSRGYTNPLTATEIELVARYPHRAPALLRLCEQAARTAWAQRHRDKAFPRDAFRHVYWSWLLTREFGPEFAEEVTDAHEYGATYEFGSANRQMDLHNNAVGRAYALAAVPESELVDRVLHDPNVMRTPPAALR